jgi:hypothetical protein
MDIAIQKYVVHVRKVGAGVEILVFIRMIVKLVLYVTITVFA